jgi:hypothetical protein
MMLHRAQAAVDGAVRVALCDEWANLPLQQSTGDDFRFFGVSQDLPGVGRAEGER